MKRNKPIFFIGGSLSESILTIGEKEARDYSPFILLDSAWFWDSLADDVDEFFVTTRSLDEIVNFLSPAFR